MSEIHAGLGHNSAHLGVATDFPEITGPLCLRKEACGDALLQGFVEAIRSQGNADVRQAAISNALYRARANPQIGHLAYRVLEQIASRCRWDYRYHAEPMEAAAFFTGQSTAKNMRRVLIELADAGFVACIAVPRRAGGRPMTFVTLVCDTDDRTGASWARLKDQARERYNGVGRAKRNGCDWPLPEDAAIPQIEALNVEAMPHHEAETAVLNDENLTVRDCNASKQGNAMPYHEDQTVSKKIVKEEIIIERNATEDCNHIQPSATTSQTANPQGILSLESVPPSCMENLLRQDQFQRFFELAVGWRKKSPKRAGFGEEPITRARTDANLASGMQRYAQTSTDILLWGVDAALLDCEERLRDGSGGSFSSCANYFSQALRTAVEKEALATTNFKAKVEGARLIHAKSMERRLAGIDGAPDKRDKSMTTHAYHEFG